MKKIIILLTAITTIANAESQLSILPNLGVTFNGKFADRTTGYSYESDAKASTIIGVDFLYGNPKGFEYGIGFEYHDVEIENNPRFKSIDNTSVHGIVRYNFDTHNEIIPFVFGKVGANFPSSDSSYDVNEGSTMSFGAGFSFDNLSLSVAYNKYDYEQDIKKPKDGEKLEDVKDGDLDYDNISLSFSYRFNLNLK